MSRDLGADLSKYILEKGLVDDFGDWLKDEIAREEEQKNAEEKKQEERWLLMKRAREVMGKYCRWVNYYIADENLPFTVYKGNRDRDFAYCVYDKATDTFSASIPYVDELNGFMLWKYNYVTGKKGRGGKKRAKGNV